MTDTKHTPFDTAIDMSGLDKAFQNAAAEMDRLLVVNAELLAALKLATTMIDEMMLGGLTRHGLVSLVETNLAPARAAIAKAAP